MWECRPLMRRQEPEQLTSFWSLTDKRSTFARHCSNDSGWPWLCSIFSGTKGKLSHFGCPQKGCTRNAEEKSSGLSSFFHSFPTITNGNFGIPTYIQFLDTHTHMWVVTPILSHTQNWLRLQSPKFDVLVFSHRFSFCWQFHLTPVLLVNSIEFPLCW